MRNTFGTNVTVTLFGESHGPEIGCVVDGLAPGLHVNEDFIAAQLALRRPVGRISTARVEPDPFRIVSGVYQGRTTGTPLCILIPNTEARSEDYVNLKNTPRPGHADYTGSVKYRGFGDPRGGGHFSGRLTAPLVAAGAIAIGALRSRGVTVGTHIARLAGIADRPFDDLGEDVARLGSLPFAVLDEAAGEKMRASIETAAKDGDSVGGILESAVLGLPAGLGEPWFDTVEGLLAHALFSIPAVKAVEFGDGFGLAEGRGSETNDPFRIEAGRVVTASNHNGGVNGGLTNGMPLIFRTAVKPTPSIGLPQQTVDLSAGENVELTLTGRHDPCIVHRARVVQDSLTALVLLDLIQPL
ncbi:MAG: chorismate synthase [Oscillospiraceae bacterium]|nr:chorismate synthase [Oscillospiraceae bacterium]